MPFNVTSSNIGVDLNNTSTTQLFALNTMVAGTGDSEWVYAQCTGALITGNLVNVTPNGTAFACTMGHLSSSPALLGFVQGNWTAADYGWVARRGMPVPVLCSGTAATNVQLYLAASAGAISTTAGAGTLAGIELVVSASTVSLVTTTAVLTWPRCTAPFSLG